MMMQLAFVVVLGVLVVGTRSSFVAKPVVVPVSAESDGEAVAAQAALPYEETNNILEYQYAIKHYYRYQYYHGFHGISYFYCGEFPGENTCRQLLP